MNTYTIIAYILPDGGHYVQTVEATDPNEAGTQLRTKLGLQRDDFEIVGIAEGAVKFLNFDPSKLNMAPFSPASP